MNYDEQFPKSILCAVVTYIFEQNYQWDKSYEEFYNYFYNTINGYAFEHSWKGECSYGSCWDTGEEDLTVHDAEPEPEAKDLSNFLEQFPQLSEGTISDIFRHYNHNTEYDSDYYGGRQTYHKKHIYFKDILYVIAKSEEYIEFVDENFYSLNDFLSLYESAFNSKQSPEDFFEILEFKNQLDNSLEIKESTQSHKKMKV